MSTRRWVTPRVFTGLLLLGALVGLVLDRGDAEAFLELLRRVRPGWIAVGVVLQLGTYASFSLLLRALVARTGRPPSLPWLYGLGVAKLFTDQALPTAGVGGTLLTERALERQGVARPTATAAVLVVLSTTLAAQALTATAGLAIVGVHRDLTSRLAGLAVGCALLGIAFPVWIAWLRRHGSPAWLSRRKVAGPLLDAIARADPRVLADPRLVVLAIGAEEAVVLLDCATLWAMFRALQRPEPFGTALAGMAMGNVAKTMGLVPGGLGTFEAAATLTLRALGVEVETALAAVLLARGLANWLPLIPGAWLARRELVAIGDLPASGR